MTKILKILLTAGLCTILLCCCSESAAENGDNPSEPQNSEASDNASADSSPWHSCVYDLGYETYFSKERAYEDLGSDFCEYTFGVNGSGGLYRYPSNALSSEIQREFLFPEYYISAYAIVFDELIFSADGDKICHSTLGGENFEVLFEIPDGAKGSIAWIFADEAVIWFQSDDTVYRLHRMSGMLDEIIQKENMAFWRPLSNYTIKYSVYSDEYLAFIEGGGKPVDWGLGPETVTYIYNSKTGDEHEAKAEP